MEHTQLPTISHREEGLGIILSSGVG